MPNYTVLDIATEIKEHRDWLLALSDKLWKRVNSYERARKNNLVTHERVRQLTLEEIQKIKDVAKYFIIVPINADYGFNFGIKFYDNPTIVGVEPSCFFTISGGSLPEGMNNSFETAWKEFSPLSHNKANEKLLTFYKLHVLRSKGYYDY